MLFDIAIAGGGPAGAAAAILLTRAGAQVALIDAGKNGPSRLEGAAPRLVAALKAQGLTAEGLGSAVSRRADWGPLSGTPNREHPLIRPRFDAGLRAQARAEGVTVVRGAVARLRAGQALLADGREVRTGLMIEARGRRAPVAGARLRGPATVAVGGWTGPAGEGAAIAARPEGWTWTAASPAGTWTQASLDAAEGRNLAEAFKRITGRPLPDAPLVRAAELRLSHPELDPGMPRIGDAAVAIEPLSGHGLFWALASALHTVPLAHALLNGQADLAARFYRARVVETFYRQARVARDFYRLAGVDGPFWAVRAAWPDNEPAEARPPATPRLSRQVVVKAGRLAWADTLVSPRDPAGVAFVRGREIAPILARAGRGPLPDRAAFAARVMPDAPPHEAGLIHDWLTDRGVTTADLPRDMEVTT